MEYTVYKLGKMAGVSTRTLRYYDEIGLLKPAGYSLSGYRIYRQEQVDKLQQILFYRELEVSLGTIKKIIDDPLFDGLKALHQHQEMLLEKRKQIDKLIANVEKSIKFKEGNADMTDKEKFEGFKQKMINDNEQKYGKEIRQKYGEEKVDKSNQIIMKMTQDEYNDVSHLASKILETLRAAMEVGDPADELGQKAADLHRQWLCYYWDSYSKEAHAGLAQMYVDDERFKAYYDKEKPGTAEFLRDAVLIYTGQK